MPKVTLQPSGLELEVAAGERILDAARRLGLDCPHSCRNGNCEICAALLVSGQVRQRSQLIEQGEIFTCLAEPESDCELHWDGVLAPGELPVREFACQLIGCRDLGGDVVGVRLRAPAGRSARYHAGQYLLIQREDGEHSAFSLASAPHQGRELELHVLVREDSARQLLDFIQRQGFARVRMPFGDTHLAELPDVPLVLIAAGTGMAQMHSLIEHCRARGFRHRLHVYWGVRQAGDFYEVPDWEQWQHEPLLEVHRVVSDDPHWSGRRGLLHEAVREDFPELSGIEVYASGSPAMIYATLDALVAAGMKPEQMHADVFAYAPRP